MLESFTPVPLRGVAEESDDEDLWGDEEASQASRVSSHTSFRSGRSKSTSGGKVADGGLKPILEQVTTTLTTIDSRLTRLEQGPADAAGGGNP